MLSTTKKIAAIALLGFAFGGLSTVSGQDKKDDKNKDKSKQETITVSKDEESAIKKIEKAKTLDEKMQLTGEFIKKYPQSPARKQLSNYILGQMSETKDDAQIIQNSEKYIAVFNQPEEADLVLPAMIFSYVQLKRPKDAFDAGQKYFARHPEDVRSRLTLVIEGSNQVRTNNKDFIAASREHAVKAIELIEADKRPADIEEAQWGEYKTKWLPQLYQSVGLIEFSSGDKAKAKTNLEKATALDTKDVNSWILLASMLDEDYQATAAKYNAGSTGPDSAALLKEANEKMDATIEAFARIVALTDGKPETKAINDQVRENLQGYYQYRHKNTDGLQALIDKYKK